ncbi:hypothetical protein GGE06_005649 [Streptomyces sp. SFB5A]|uniref:Uncharacterized protein n=1 Tax=Streptomyces nymphaeiformis TaxID=2663842 RepID=A0A7W7U4F1_9ACTN|nr:hypothetical protein [Streptomyces nymphaeiformis]
MGDAEVEDAGAGRGEDDVLRFDVPMDDPRRMDGREGLGGAGGEGEQSGAGEGAVRCEVLVEGETWSVGGGQPWGVRVRIGREEGYETRSLDAGGELDLAAETGAELRVIGLSGMDDLDRDPEACGVQAGVNGAHAARAEAPDDAVRADPLGVTGAAGLYPPAGASIAHEASVSLLRWSAWD